MEFFPPSMAFSFLTCGISLWALALFRAGGQKGSFIKALGPLAPLGRLSLTVFVAHHLIGYGIASAAGLVHGLDLPAALAMVLLAWALALIASLLWARAGYRFSLEWAVRALRVGVSSWREGSLGCAEGMLCSCGPSTGEGGGRVGRG